MKLKLHSSVDVITNSSTVIYTQATKETVKVVKSLLKHFLNALGLDDDVDLWFSVRLWPFLSADSWRYKRLDYYFEHNEYDEEKDEDDLYSELENNPPEWWNDISKVLGNYDRSEYQEWIYITPKTENEQVNKIAKLIEDLLNTIETEEVSC